MAPEHEYVPISCADYEILEMACMDRYDVELTTHDGRTVVGKAVDLAVSRPKNSWSFVTRTGRLKVFAWIRSDTWQCSRALRDSTSTRSQPSIHTRRERTTEFAENGTRESRKVRRHWYLLRCDVSRVTIVPREETAIVGGGNSAGQAAVYLAETAEKVYVIVSLRGLGASMSQYLLRRIETTPNIELVTGPRSSSAGDSLAQQQDERRRGQGRCTPLVDAPI